MRWYPDLASARGRQLRRDLLVLLSLLVFAALAWLVRDAVLQLTVISTGLTGGASEVQESWNSVGRAMAGVPLVGDALRDAVVGLSDATLGSAVEAGDAITAAVTASADILALVTFAVPAALVGLLWLPRRLARARRWHAAAAALGGPPPPADLLAMRALCCLPMTDLLRAAPKPFEAYRSGDYARLVRALYEHEGVILPAD